jgi:allantoinase
LISSRPSPDPTFDLIVRTGEIVLVDQVLTADIAIRDGQIVEIAPAIAGSTRAEIDANGLHVLPGIVDIHVHFNDPGRTDWEGWETGSLAASAGGTTTVADMPLNAHPPTLDGASFDAKVAAAAGTSRVDFALWGGLTPLNLGQMEQLATRGVVGFKAFMSNSGIDDFPRAEDATLREGMQRSAALGLPVAVHAEDEEMTARLAADTRQKERTSFTDYAASRPPETELEAILRALDIARETGCALHVVHVSTAAGLNAIAQARAQGHDVTAETCPHYLLLSTADADQLGALAKCAPPLRDESERLALVNAFTSGQVQIIASDHSPCPSRMKEGNDFFAIWGGIAGCQSLFHAALEALSENTSPDLPALMEMLAANPARRLRLAGKGRIAPGFDADLTLVNLTRRFTLAAADLRDRHRASPFVGSSFPGRVEQVLLRGQPIVQHGEAVGPARGRLIRPAA